MHAYQQRWALVLLVALAGLGRALAKVRSNASPPPLGYEPMWAYASRAAYDPTGNSTLLGACRRLLGEPSKAVLARQECKPDSAHSWVPTVKEPRYVDVRFEAKATLLANRVAGVQVLVLNRGTLDPPINSIELMLSPKNGTGITSIGLYLGKPGDVIVCPGFNTFKLPPGLLTPSDQPSLLDATVLGLRLNVTSGTVPVKSGLPSISAVALLVGPASA